MTGKNPPNIDDGQNKYLQFFNSIQKGNATPVVSYLASALVLTLYISPIKNHYKITKSVNIEKEVKS